MVVIDKQYAHNLSKEKVSCSGLILFAKLLGLLTYLELNKISSSNIWVFWVACNEIFIGSLS
jgi:hypothetical protein